MNGVERFEDLVAWQKARELTKAVYKITLRRAFIQDPDLKRQMRRASVSIMSNIAEGFERNGLREFHQFLSIAKASCAELRSQLYVALDAEYLQASEYDHLLAQAQEVARVIGGLRASVEKRIGKY
jgi:four helix bundle protein